MTAEGAAIQVRIAADRMSATLTIEAGLSEHERSVAALEALLDERGVARSAERTAAVQHASHAAARGRVESVIAAGRAPVHGRDAAFEPAPLLSERRHPAAETAGRVDHHELSTFTIVHAGDRLGRMTPARQGVDGVDVTGRALAAREGRTAKVLFDDSVTVGEPDPHGVSEVRAARAGLVVRHGDLIRVCGRLDVPADVDFSVGNIDFPGDVRINGGVRDCFVVKAGGAVEVRGLVEAATLHAGRDVRLVQGMAGREKGSLTAGRDCEARYLEGLHVLIGRDAVIGKEITNSRVEIGRTLRAPTGAVIGGSLWAASDCEVAQLGSEAGVATEIILGKMPPFESVLRKGLRALPILEERLRVSRERLEQLKHASGRMTASQAEELTELEFGMSEAHGKVKALGEGLGHALASLRSHARARLVVNRVACPGVKIWMGRFLLQPRAEVRGPFELTLSAAGEPLFRQMPSGAAEPASAHFRTAPDPTYVDVAEVERVAQRACAA